MNKLFIAIAMLITCTGFAAVDTASIYFSIGSYQLTTTHKKTIDSLMYNDVLAPGRRVGIIGYADIVGDEKSNKELSEKRAHAVAGYLQYMGVDTQFIEQVTGVGEVSRAENTTGYPQDRKVAIIPGGFKSMPKPKSTPTTKRTPEPVKTIDLSNVTTNTTIVLENILFVGDSAIFLPESTPALEALYKAIHDHPQIKIAIEGHVCCMTFFGNMKHDLTAEEAAQDVFNHTKADRLSNDRAKAVYDYLIEEGIDPERLQYKGYGMSRPLQQDGRPNAYDIKNRRVEVRVLAK